MIALCVAVSSNLISMPGVSSLRKSPMERRSHVLPIAVPRHIKADGVRREYADRGDSNRRY